jgi:hypothetical protein
VGFQELQAVGVGEHFSATAVGVRARAVLPVGALALGEAEVDEHAEAFLLIVEEVGGFDVAVENAGFVYVVQAVEETSEVVPHVVDEEVSVIESEVEVAEVGEDGDYLVQVSKCCDQGAYILRVPEFVQ